MSSLNVGHKRARVSLPISSAENNISVAPEEQLSPVPSTASAVSSFSLIAAVGVQVSPSSPSTESSDSSNAARLVAYMNQSSSLLFDPDEEEDEDETFEEEEEEEQAVTTTVSCKRPAPTPSTTSPSTPPAAFVCPLTLEVMLDPVLDAQGNTYERQAIVTWLDTNRVSPISRQPLHPSMLVPNNSLKEMIHEFMGRQWVEEQRNELQQQQKEMEQKRMNEIQRTSNHSNSSSSTNSCVISTQPSSPFETSEVARSRGKIDAFLAQMSSGSDDTPSLRLNEQGCAAFRYDSVTVVLDVAGTAGASMFSLYTRDLLPKQILNYSSPPQASPFFSSQSHSAAAASTALLIKDRVLQLNFLQGETRGGVLSLKIHPIAAANGGSVTRVEEEIIFSYNDRVAELSATDFNNILLNFAESAISLRTQLISLYQTNMMRAAAEEEQSLLNLRQQQQQIYQNSFQGQKLTTVTVTTATASSL